MDRLQSGSRGSRWWRRPRARTTFFPFFNGPVRRRRPTQYYEHLFNFFPLSTCPVFYFALLLLLLIFFRLFLFLPVRTFQFRSDRTVSRFCCVSVCVGAYYDFFVLDVVVGRGCVFWVCFKFPSSSSIVYIPFSLLQVWFLFYIFFFGGALTTRQSIRTSRACTNSEQCTQRVVAAWELAKYAYTRPDSIQAIKVCLPPSPQPQPLNTWIESERNKKTENEIRTKYTHTQTRTRTHIEITVHTT